MATEHKFRYLLPPGSNFQFVARARTFFVVSLLLLAAAIGSLFVNKAVRGSYMNWTIDFKGGTEVIYAFRDPADPSKYLKPDAGAVRAALSAAGEDGFDVSEMSWTDGKAAVTGMVVKTPRFSALSKDQADKTVAAFQAQFADKQLEKVAWSGERLFVRSKASFAGVDVAAAFTAAGLEVKPWTEEDTARYGHPDEGTGEYNATFAVWGIDRQLGQVLEKALGGAKVSVVQSYGVGAKAGDQLRNDAIKSLIYAMFLVMLYLAVRFDIRYAPGAAFATLHDAIMVIGVFAVTWTEVSLTSVAAVLTVIGYSVNDTVVIFDRIRENVAKHKDKKLERIVDLSVNETLVRSILTSLTVFATTLIMNIFGEGLVRNFAFAMNIGVVVGSYSSIFLAAPIFLWISRKWYSGPARVRAGITPAAAATVGET